MIERRDLTIEEWDWLVQLSRHQTAFLTVGMDRRLKELGVVEQGLGGAIVSRTGRDLLAKEFAPAIRARKHKLIQVQNAQRTLMEARRGR